MIHLLYIYNNGCFAPAVATAVAEMQLLYAENSVFCNPFDMQNGCLKRGKNTKSNTQKTRRTRCQTSCQISCKKHQKTAIFATCLTTPHPFYTPLNHPNATSQTVAAGLKY